MVEMGSLGTKQLSLLLKVQEIGAEPTAPKVTVKFCMISQQIKTSGLRPAPMKPMAFLPLVVVGLHQKTRETKARTW